MKPRAACTLPLFFVLTLALLLAWAPAALLDHQLERASAGRLRLGEAQGSLWQGGGQLAAADDGRLPQPWLALRWVFQPSSLLRGGLAWQLWADGAPAFRLQLNASGAALQDIAIDVPSAPLLRSLPQAALQFGWNGRLRLQGNRLDCGWDRRCRGQVTADWQSASVDVLPQQALGDYRALLQADGETLAITLSSPAANALQLAGSVALARGQKPALDLRLGGDPQLLARLRPLLQQGGRVEAGTLAIRYP